MENENWTFGNGVYSTAWEYISHQNSQYKIQSIEVYLQHINDNYFGKKKKNLLLEKIPTNPVERQIKDTQYITVAVKNELAKIVGSDNVKTSTGEVTNILRSRWGLKKLFMELTESRFKQMELWDWNKETNQPNSEWVNKYFDKEKQKHIYEIKNWSKRYDHRHHAIDALVVALTLQSHIQRLNNLNKYLQDELTNRREEFKIEVKDDETILEAFFNLEKHRREEIQKQIESSRHFEKPFEDLVKQAKAFLEAMVVSIKPKDKLGVSIDKFDKNTPNKNLKSQIKIKGGLHQETNYGKTKDPETGLLRDTKTIDISNLKAKDISQIIDQAVLAKEIDNHRKNYDSMKEAFTGEGLKAFNENRFQTKKPTELKPPVYKVKVWYSNKQTEASTLQRLYDDNDKLSVVTGDNYLFMVMEKAGKRIFDIASLYDSTDIAKRSLREKDEKYKQRIVSEKIALLEYELGREKFSQQKKLEEKISNAREKTKEKLQVDLDELVSNEDKITFHFSLQQNDIVYLPESVDDPVLGFNNNELKKWLNDIENKKRFSRRLYKVVDFNQGNCFFIPINYANIISASKNLSNEELEDLKRKRGDVKLKKYDLNYVEFGTFGTSAKTEVNEDFVKELVLKKEFDGKKPLKIQDTCIKLEIDWLGNISPAKNIINNQTNELNSIVSEPETIYQKRILKTFSTFVEMENDQLAYYASLQPEKLLQNLRELNLAVFGYKNEANFTMPDKKIKFDTE